MDMYKDENRLAIPLIKINVPFESIIRLQLKFVKSGMNYRTFEC